MHVQLKGADPTPALRDYMSIDGNTILLTTTSESMPVNPIHFCHAPNAFPSQLIHWYQGFLPSPYQHFVSIDIITEYYEELLYVCAD